MTRCAALLALVTLGACGGGSSHGSPPPPTGWAVAPVGDHGAVLSTIDDGQTWTTRLLLEDSRGALGVFFFDAMTGWVVGFNQIVHTEDGGKSWTSQLRTVSGLSQTPLLKDVAFADRDLGIAVGYTIGGRDRDPTSPYPLILSTSDGGASWAAAALPDDSRGGILDRVCAAPNGLAMAVSVNNGIKLVSRDFGRSWMELEALGVEFPYAADCTDGTTLWLGGTVCFRLEPKSRLVSSSDGGSSWIDRADPLPLTVCEIRALAFDGPLRGVALGTGPNPAVLLATRNGGSSWETVGAPFPGIGSFAGLVLDRETILAFGGNDTPLDAPTGVILRSSDRGGSWQQAAVPSGTGVVSDVAIPPSQSR